MRYLLISAALIASLAPLTSAHSQCASQCSIFSTTSGSITVANPCEHRGSYGPISIPQLEKISKLRDDLRSAQRSLDKPKV